MRVGLGGGDGRWAEARKRRTASKIKPKIPDDIGNWQYSPLLVAPAVIRDRRGGFARRHIPPRRVLV